MIEFREVDRRALDRCQRYRRSDAGRASSRATDTKRQYAPARRQNRERQNERMAAKRLEAYLSRPFVGWDGEGGDNADGRHVYFLLASSDGQLAHSEDGMSTVDIFELFLSARRGVTHVGFGTGYDVNKILRDVPRGRLKDLWENGQTFWGRYWIEWRPGKSFRVKRVSKREKSHTFTLYDIYPFFQCSFVKACDEYFNGEWEGREHVIAGKADRGGFEYGSIDRIIAYNAAELRTLVRLADTLRERLFRAGIRVTRWDGPGAIATAIYREHGTKQALASTPQEVAERARYAYAGGRFEIIRYGHHPGPAWQYDIRSAYPHAIRKLPCLAHGEWSFVESPPDVAGFGVYRIEVDAPLMPRLSQPHPLWHRTGTGTVVFNTRPSGFYWSPEAAIAQRMGARVVDGWEYRTHCECNPFDFIEPMYNKRAALKKAGDGAQVGLKLGLNSLYGKLAQQIGWRLDKDGSLRIPPYHCLEWAGYVTSHCRAQVFEAAMCAPDDIIAFETDAVFSRVSLPLKLGTRLGEWEESRYRNLTYFKSGMWFAETEDGRLIEKTRGFNRGTLTRETVIEALQSQWGSGEPINQVYAQETRFITLGAALHWRQGMKSWGQWLTAPKQFDVLLFGKRLDADLVGLQCQGSDGLFETVPRPLPFWAQESKPYEVAWVDELDDGKWLSPDGDDMPTHRRMRMERVGTT